MRFHQPVGIAQHFNGNINEVNNTASVDNSNINQIYLSQAVQLDQLKKLLQAHNYENNEIKTSNLNKNNSTSNHLQYKADSAYFKSFLDNHCFISNNGNDRTTSALTEENLTKFITESAYENCTTNLSSAAQQRFLSNIQRRENLIKLDLATTNYMNKNGTKKSSDSAGCSNESSPVDSSYLEEHDITSPAPSSSTDLSSSAQLDVKRDYPRGIINPNYPGFQHLAHTLSEHFIDHHQNLEHSTDSEDDFEYESNDNLENNNAGNMNDSNNNTNNAAGVRDLNSNQNLRISSHSMYVDDKEDSNMQFQSKVFCDRKLFNLLNSDTNIESSNENLSAFENISSSGDEIDDEELDEELEPALINHFDGPDKEMTEVCEPSTRMEYDEDELDVSVEDDWAIKTELESIDKLSYDFESVDCDLETYLRRYDYPNNCKMFNSELIKEDIERQMECFMHDSRSLTPDILLEHGNKKTINDETSEVTKSTELTPESTSSSAINLDERNYQPDLIKNITDVIKTNGDDVQMARQFVEKIMSDSDNENLTIFKHEATNANDQQARSLELFLNNNENVANSELDSFGEECATAPDIVGDFEKEIEQEIGLIVSGYQMKYIKSPEYDCALDEQKFMEHIQNFSKMGDAALSKVNDTIKPQSSGSESNQLIPTAIVKPKYQKLAFDDRQLPVVGSTDNNDSPWFDSNETASTITTTTPRKVQKHLPNFDRRSQKPSFVKQQRKLLNKSDDRIAVNAVSEKEAINSVRYSEKDVDCSSISKNIPNSVAIVQPQKKYDVNSTDKVKDDKPSLVKSFPSDSEIKLKIAETFAITIGPEIKSNSIAIKKKEVKENTALFDVYNIETALPVIDLEAIETHLMAAKEEERKRKNDRETIRRRLAMGEEDDYFTDHLAVSRPLRKPNLQTRLQNGKNLQICFMNEAASDTESQSSDSETCPKLSKFNGNSHRSNKFLNRSGRSSLKISPSSSNSSASLANQSDVRKERPKSLSLGPPINESSEVDFYTHQSRMQVEARMALAQAKDMAHMQMEIDRKNQRSSPITELVHKTLGKVGVRVPETKRRMCRQMLTGMNVAQLQIIVNDLHTFIETLNERLVHYLMDRDDLHMKQDSMLVDVEDITRYLAEKTETNGSSSQSIKKLQHPKHINTKSTLCVTLSSFSSSTSSTSTSIAKHV